MAESSNRTAFLTEFIDLYRHLPCLWKIKSKSYSNRREKNKAYEKLLQLYQNVNKTATIDTVKKKKINNLRSAFRKELKRVRKSKRSGEGSENIYVPALWYFHLLMFTADQEEPRTSVSNDQSDEESEIEIENVEQEEFDGNTDLEDNTFSPLAIGSPSNDPILRTPSTSSTAETPSRTSSRTSTVTTNRTNQKRSRESLIKRACESICSSTQDEFDAVGNNAACKLRRMNENQRAYAEYLINRTILFGIQGKLNDDSDVILNKNYNHLTFHTGNTSLNYPNSNEKQANAYTNYVYNTRSSSNTSPTYERSSAGPSSAAINENTSIPGPSYQGLSEFVYFKNP